MVQDALYRCPVSASVLHPVVERIGGAISKQHTLLMNLKLRPEKMAIGNRVVEPTHGSNPRINVRLPPGQLRYQLFEIRHDL